MLGLGATDYSTLKYLYATTTVKARFWPCLRRTLSAGDGYKPNNAAPPWRQPRGKSLVNLSQMLPPGVSI